MTEEVTSLIADGFSADRGKAEIVIGFVKGRTTDVNRSQPIDHLRHLDLIGDRQYDEMTIACGLKAATCFQAGMTDLHDLIGQGKVTPNERVDVGS